jgi:hypothetical protein
MQALVRSDLVCRVGQLVHADGRFACQLPLVVAYCAALHQAGNLVKEHLGPVTITVKFNRLLEI